MQRLHHLNWKRCFFHASSWTPKSFTREHEVVLTRGRRYDANCPVFLDKIKGGGAGDFVLTRHRLKTSASRDELVVVCALLRLTELHP
jgi:hypothetical protein